MSKSVYNLCIECSNPNDQVDRGSPMMVCEHGAVIPLPSIRPIMAASQDLAITIPDLIREIQSLRQEMNRFAVNFDTITKTLEER